MRTRRFVAVALVVAALALQAIPAHASTHSPARPAVSTAVEQAGAHTFTCARWAQQVCAVLGLICPRCTPPAEAAPSARAASVVTPSFTSAEGFEAVCAVLGLLCKTHCTHIFDRESGSSLPALLVFAGCPYFPVIAARSLERISNRPCSRPSSEAM